MTLATIIDSVNYARRLCDGEFYVNGDYARRTSSERIKRMGLGTNRVERGKECQKQETRSVRKAV